MQFRTMGIAIGAAGIAFAISACGGSGTAENAPDPQESAAQGEDPAAGGEEASAPEPDLEGIPDVVAEVNGTEITKDEFTGIYESQFQQVTMQSQQTGQEVDQDKLKNDTVESLIGVELLEQEASDRGIEVSDSDVDDALTKTAETNQMSAEDFLAAMEEQGMPEDEVRTQLASQETVGQLVENEAGPFEATDEELQEAYNQAKSQQEQMGAQQPQQGAQAPQEMPPLDEVKPQLEEQVTGQKKGEATDALATTLREKADVTVHL